MHSVRSVCHKVPVGYSVRQATPYGTRRVQYTSGYALRPYGYIGLYIPQATPYGLTGTRGHIPQATPYGLTGTRDCIYLRLRHTALRVLETVHLPYTCRTPAEPRCTPAVRRCVLLPAPQFTPRCSLGLFGPKTTDTVHLLYTVGYCTTPYTFDVWYKVDRHQKNSHR